MYLKIDLSVYKMSCMCVGYPLTVQLHLFTDMVCTNLSTIKIRAFKDF